MSSESCVYVADEQHAWLPAHVLEQSETHIKVKVFSVDESEVMEEEKVLSSSTFLPLQNVNASGQLLVMPDMVDLPSLHEVRIG
jgi:hypothetical protein